jgi:hypothetical protein
MKNWLKKLSQRKWAAAEIGEIYGITGENVRQAVITTNKISSSPVIL